MHIHEIVFEVVDRQDLALDDDDEVVEAIELDGNPVPPEPWESGYKDTVIAYRGQVTGVRAQFKTPDQFVWHGHIVEHLNNETMRPCRIGPAQPRQPGWLLPEEGARAGEPSAVTAADLTGEDLESNPD